MELGLVSLERLFNEAASNRDATAGDKFVVYQYVARELERVRAAVQQTADSVLEVAIRQQRDTER